VGDHEHDVRAAVSGSADYPLTFDLEEPGRESVKDDENGSDRLE
jgi:hypothetical protein